MARKQAWQHRRDGFLAGIRMAADVAAREAARRLRAADMYGSNACMREAETQAAYALQQLAAKLVDEAGIIPPATPPGKGEGEP